MSDEVERIAEEIHGQYPVTVAGVALDWEQVTRNHPERVAVFREAARNRLRESKALKLLDASGHAGS